MTALLDMPIGSELQALRRRLGEAIWEVRMAEARRRQAILVALEAERNAGATIAAAAARVAPGIRTARLEQWCARWQADGLAGLVDRRGGRPSRPRPATEDENTQLPLLPLAAPDTRGPAPRQSRSSGGGPRPLPLVKWAGSKASVLPWLLDSAPHGFERYHEPFVGGGALFFALRGRGVTSPAFLSDLNNELVNLYRVARDTPEELIDALRAYVNTAECFHRVRGLHPDRLPPPARAARTVFLNRTCFNGLYRVNRAGIFNVPFGRHSGSTFFRPEAIRRAHRALAGAHLDCTDFAGALEAVRPDDFVYLDPPYPTGKRGGDGFHGYQAGGFGAGDHRRLADHVRRLDRLGARVLVSNSDCSLVRELYRGFRMEALSVHRQVGGHRGRRGRAMELLISNYAPPGRLPGL